MNLRTIFALLAAGAVCCACGGQPDAAVDGRVFDPCHATLEVSTEATPSQRVALLEAARLWNEAAGLEVVLVDVHTSDSIEVQFQRAAGAFRGLYDPESGVVFINSGLTTERSRAITAAHELGHAFGLAHVSPSRRTSLMNPGNISVGPAREDVQLLHSLWGSCSELATEQTEDN